MINEQENKELYELGLVEEISEGRMSTTLALQIAFEKGKESCKEVYEPTLRRLTIASRMYIENDTDEALAELEQAKFIAEELLLGRVEAVKIFMEQT